MRQLELHVGGKGCRRCVREVTARLRDVPGVATVAANPGDSLVRLSGRMEVTDVLAAFTGTTYGPAVQDDGDAERGARGGADSGGTGAGQATS
jgi:copper chaperone CopZ